MITLLLSKRNGAKFYLDHNWPLLIICVQLNVLIDCEAINI